ncbi:hypothetical protein [Bradyrhizobium sp. RDT46]|uniref:hypothetical protein n=1 Tax=Bradyrhizobium sp. RDT46 TaxID=3341829 RepID=UPI0035C6DB3F
MSFLDGDLAQEIADALADADVPRAGVLRKLTVVGQSGSGELIYASTDHPFTGWREDYSTLFAAQSGISSEDVRIVIVAKTCVVEPAPIDYLQIGGVWHRIRKIERVDPANATVAAQCFREEPSV